MRLGILGGTFNPIHNAHLCMAELAAARCALDRVLFLPAADPPHKPLSGDVAFADRLAMVTAALTGHPRFVASDLEAQRPGKSYSVQTLEWLQRLYPDEGLYFIVGGDSFRDIASWWEFSRLFCLAHIVVVPRVGVQLPSDPTEVLPVAMRGEFCYDAAAGILRHRSGNQVILLEERCPDISSTQIRALLAERRPVHSLLPAAVERYINSHGLYTGPGKV